MTVVEIANSPTAIRMYESLGIKYGACLIASQVPDGVILATYDKEFQKVMGIKIATPKEMLASKRY